MLNVKSLDIGCQRAPADWATRKRSSSRGASRKSGLLNRGTLWYTPTSASSAKNMCPILKNKLCLSIYLYTKASHLPQKDQTGRFTDRVLGLQKASIFPIDPRATSSDLHELSKDPRTRRDQQAIGFQKFLAWHGGEQQLARQTRTVARCHAVAQWSFALRCLVSKP